MTYSVYILKHPETNWIVYVGCTGHPEKRLGEHKSVFLKKHGFIPVMEIVKTFSCHKSALEAEWQLIQKYSKTEILLQSTDRKRVGGPPRSFYRAKNTLDKKEYLKKIYSK